MHDRGRAITVDANEDVIAAGTFEGTVDFGSGERTGSGLMSSWITKRGAVDGAEVWTITLGSAKNAYVEVTALTTDDDRNVIVIGTFRGTPDFGGGTATTNGEAGFVAKYSPQGNLAWVRGLGASSGSTGRSVVVDAADRIFVSGSFQDVIETPTGLLSATGTEAYMASFESDGTLRWVQAFPGAGSLGLTMTSTGTITALTSTSQRTTFGGWTVDPTARATQMLARFTTDGDVISAHAVGAPGISRVGGTIAMGPNDEIVTTAVHFAEAASPAHATISTIDTTGAEMWSSRTERGLAVASSTAVLPNGVAISGGYVTDPAVQFEDGETLAPMFLVSHDTHGSVVQTRSYGDRFVGPNAAITAVAAADTGAVAFTGQIDQAIDFGTGAVSHRGAHDAVIVVLDAAP